ncbi:hypothetical protein NCC49_004805 [Naganishia albida]|nr:hypothetical protein NCC49_004805 [Naganishia albida]
MAAQDGDEDDRDFMMSSSSPVPFDASESNQGAAQLVKDMVHCQLESGVGVEEAVCAVEASAVGVEGYSDRRAAHTARSLDLMFNPYSMTQLNEWEMLGRAVQK